MNDYYIMMCDLESDEKSIDNDYWFLEDNDDWPDYSSEEIDSDWEEF
jgi:hypothetical protein